MCEVIKSLIHEICFHKLELTPIKLLLNDMKNLILFVNPILINKTNWGKTLEKYDLKELVFCLVENALISYHCDHVK